MLKTKSDLSLNQLCYLCQAILSADYSDCPARTKEMQVIENYWRNEPAEDRQKIQKLEGANIVQHRLLDS